MSFENEPVENLFATVAIILCNRATRENDEDAIAAQIADVPYYELFLKCVKWIDEIDSLNDEDEDEN
jgi:hypothetical protein